MDFLYALAEYRTAFAGSLFQIVTWFGQELIILGIVCLVFWCVDKDLAYKTGIAFFLSGLIVQTAKITFRIDRPWVKDPLFKPVESAVSGATGYSFPSGHSQGAASLYSTLAFKFKKTWAKLLMILTFLLVGFSRMFLGVHTPADVATGLGIGLIFSVLVYFLLDRIKAGSRAHLFAALIMAVASAATAGYSYILYSGGTIALGYASDCFKAASAGIGFAAGWYIEGKYIDFSVKASLKGQIIKYTAGLAAAIAIEKVPKLIFGDSLMVSVIRYAAATFWITAIYPAIFTAIQKKYAEIHMVKRIDSKI